MTHVTIRSMSVLAASVVTLATLGCLAPTPADAAAAKVPVYRNCTSMNKTYPHGVGRKGAHDHVSGHSKPVTNFRVSTAIYNANKARDRDKDGIACEKH